VELRPYQREAIDHIADCFARGRTSPCLVLPTGSGKTATVLSYLRDREPESSALWLVPRVALIDQTWRNAKKVGFNPEKLIVTTVQSLLSESKQIPKSQICVVDEAHFFFGTKEWASIAHSFPRRIAATATPTRADGAPLRELCDDLIVGASRNELIQNGFLPSVVTYAPEKRLSTEAWSPVDAYKEFSPGEKCIVFCATVQHAIDVRNAFLGAKIRAGSVTIDSDGDLSLHASGFLDVLTNVYMVSVGYDDPTVTTCILARPFGNATSYIQAAGRARGLGAKRVKIIDLYGACHEWGMLEEDRSFSLGDEQPMRVKKDARLAVCGSCRELYRENPFESTCPTCRAPRKKFQTPKEKRRAAVLARYAADTEGTRLAYLSKMTAIMRAKNLPVWVPVYNYKKRYGERPPIAWLERVGLR
jgi:superfamily II DNA or RNA helicase